MALASVGLLVAQIKGLCEADWGVGALVGEWVSVTETPGGSRAVSIS